MIHDIQEKLDLKPMDYVIIVRITYQDNTYHQNEEQLMKLLKKFGGITNENKK